jgi:hypothetical protein
MAGEPSVTLNEAATLTACNGSPVCGWLQRGSPYGVYVCGIVHLLTLNDCLNRAAAATLAVVNPATYLLATKN